MLRNRRASSVGDSSQGQLGHGSFENSSRPVEIAALAAKDIHAVCAGEHHSVFLAADGNIFSCGSNDESQLGHQEPTDEAQPLPALVALGCFNMSRQTPIVTTSTIVYYQIG